MTNAHSIFCAAMMMFSVLNVGCGSTKVDGNAKEAEMPLVDESPAADRGYGYEMIPLQLNVGAVAPAGNAVLPNGRVAPEELLRQATARIDGLRACYATALATDPTLSGQIRAIYHFQTDGVLRSVQLDDASTMDPVFVDCVTTVLGTMQMPASNAGALEVRYPIDLDPTVFATAQ